jgi:Flp pilus assembly protein TadG
MMRARARFRGDLQQDWGSQLVEFAVTLPLLVVFVVGIFDFSGAFTLKQKLTNVARDAARVAAADPASDVPAASTTLPASVADAYQVIANYFTANNLNNCGLTVATGSLTSPAIWTFSSSGSGCPAPVTTTCGVTSLCIIINRGYYFPESGSSTAPTVTCASPGVGSQTIIGTCVSIQYAYQWRFGNVDTLLGSSVALPNTISVTAVAMNEN